MIEPVIVAWDDPATHTKHINLALTPKVLDDWLGLSDLLGSVARLSAYLVEKGLPQVVEEAL